MVRTATDGRLQGRPAGRPSRRRARLLAILVVAALLGGGLLSGLIRPASAAPPKEVYIPATWTTTGEVPWKQERTKESANFVLLWGEKSGTDPLTAPGSYRFDPADILAQLERVYAYYVDTMKFTPEIGVMAKYKIVVIITQTWNRTELSAHANGGQADGKIGVINLSPSAAGRNSWGLAHELAHVFQNFTVMDGDGLTNGAAGTFWETSAEFMTINIYPGQQAGDLARFMRTENLAWSSSRHHYGNWMLVQFIADKRGGVSAFNRIWNSGTGTEHPLETYRRINGLTQAQFNLEAGEYAQRQVTLDYSNRASFAPFLDRFQGHQYVRAYDGIPVEAVNQAQGHYAVPAALAPSDYGYNKIKLVPTKDGGTVRVRFRGHIDAAASSGWSYGFVAVRKGVPRYGPVTTDPDGQLSFTLQPGEQDVYLTVAGAPTTVHHYDFLSGWPNQYRYPYEFRLDGAVPSGYEPGYTKPAAVGGRWHPNGGGWVADGARVADTAYVGPRAAVYGTVSGNARIEGLARVDGGGTVSGNAVVKDNAIIPDGATIGGSAVVGGDAEPTFSCTSGSYLRFDPERRCDGGPAESEVTRAVPRFPTADLEFRTGDTG